MRIKALLVSALLTTLALPAFAVSSPPPDAAITGDTTDEDFGWRVAPAGDVDGDGVQDLIVGAPSNDAIQGFAGRAYLFSGPFSGTISADDATATIAAQAFGDNLGFSVAGAGDVNNDGLDDILVGARSNDAPGIQAGRVYLFYGPVSGSLTPADADATISGAAFDEVGRAVAPAGDLNGDGFDDVLLGTDAAGGNFQGQAFVFNGPLSGFRTAASANAIITGSFSNESFAQSVASAGDVNDDGINDLIFGAPRFPLDGADTGRAYVFYGPVSGSSIATDADAILFGENVNDGFGRSVSGAGDVNGDGIADVVVGADQLFGAQTATGKAYVFYGPLAGSIQASNAGAIFTGQSARDLFGAWASGVGDHNDDGFDDVVIGAPDNAAGGFRSGRAYTFFGPLSGTIPASSADFIVTGQANDQVGLSVAGGDLDGDGSGDLIVGAPEFDDNAPGYAAIYFGAANAPELTIAATPVNPPIIIPPTGGSFSYNVDVVNVSSSTRTIDVWVTLSGPGLNRTVGPFRRTLAPGQTFHRTLTQKVARRVGAGTHTVTAHSGATFPTSEVSASFTWQKN